MPGIEYDQLYRLMQLADRVSVNLEGPTQERLNALAPKKDFQRELLSMLQLAEKIRRAHPSEKLAGTVTQFLPDGNMELALDPKRAWAERNLREAPLEIMTARRDQLLRIPGIGPVGADAIVKARRQGRLSTLTDLQK